MAGLLIIAHAPLASALQAVAAHTYPECATQVRSLDVTPAMTPEEVEQRARSLLDEVRSPEALILTDVFGATPCNAAQRLADGQQVRVVTGASVPMLWRTLCYASDPVERLVTRAVAGAQQGALQVGSARPPQNQTLVASSHVPTDRHDQQ